MYQLIFWQCEDITAIFDRPITRISINFMLIGCSNTGLTAIKNIALAHHKSGKKREDLELRDTEQVLKEDADRHGGKSHKY